MRKGKVVADEESEVENAASSDDEVKPKRKGRTTSKPPSRASSVGQSSKAAKAAAKTEVKVEPTIEESEGEDEDLLQSLAASQTTAKPTRSSAKVMPAVDEQVDKESDDGPERSLLDGHPATGTSRPRPSIVPPAPIVEVPKGPKARLVIHKLVLVNFKSYAGRQVIGPFHKV